MKSTKQRRSRAWFVVAAASLFVAVPMASGFELTEGAVMTETSQSEMSPDQALERLREGNARFVAGQQTPSDLRAEVRATATGQHPFGVVLSCLDSRVPVETVFDQGIGDLFVGRVAGNIVDDQMLGSIEFATAAAGSKLVVVMGHTACGAVKGACDNVDLGHINALVEAIRPSVEAETPEGETCNSSDSELVNRVSAHNVTRTIDEIRERSEILRELEASGQIRIVGAIYSLETGQVDFMD
jgi:carbonic anhydrase